MDFDKLIPASPGMSLEEVKRVNALTSAFGLSLTPADVRELGEARADALTLTGRVEFGGGVLPKLAAAFCASPFVYSANWAETLGELQEEFYILKNVSPHMGDDEVIERMAALFDGRAQGDVGYMDDLWEEADDGR